MNYKSAKPGNLNDDRWSGKTLRPLGDQVALRSEFMKLESRIFRPTFARLPTRFWLATSCAIPIAIDFFLFKNNPEKLAVAFVFEAGLVLTGLFLLFTGISDDPTLAIRIDASGLICRDRFALREKKIIWSQMHYFEEVEPPHPNARRHAWLLGPSRERLLRLETSSGLHGIYEVLSRSAQ